MHTEVDVSNPHGELVTGIYASVKIPLHSAANVLMIPIQAVQATGEGKGTVLVVDRNNKIEKRAVTVGLQSGAKDEIISGLQENETVVFGSQGAYQTGELVSPKLVEPSMTE
jgi:multidrug efflux pump subunit AcrA (membrane-fusion protein)